MNLYISVSFLSLITLILTYIVKIMILNNFQKVLTIAHCLLESYQQIKTQLFKYIFFCKQKSTKQSSPYHFFM